MLRCGSSDYAVPSEVSPFSRNKKNSVNFWRSSFTLLEEYKDEISFFRKVGAFRERLAMVVSLLKKRASVL